MWKRIYHPIPHRGIISRRRVSTSPCYRPYESSSSLAILAFGIPHNHTFSLTSSSTSSFSRKTYFSTNSSANNDVTMKHKQKEEKENNTNNNVCIPISQNMKMLKEIPLEDVRNFCVVAHVDHGKSSLCSRILEFVGNLNNHNNDMSKNKKANTQVNNFDDSEKEDIELLDTLSVERERGITVKAAAASMLYKHPSAKGPNGTLLLNMVDTPGHVDFGFEVTRSLSCVQGALILFDAGQGVQAQTLSVYEKAKSLNVKLIPALTKVDLPTARPVDVALSVSELFDFDPDTIIQTSARSRIGIEACLNAVAEEILPPPEIFSDVYYNKNNNEDTTTNEKKEDVYVSSSLITKDNNILIARVVDSWFEELRGVICLVQILNGELKETDRVSVLDPTNNNNNYDNNNLPKQQEHFSVQDVGLVLPKRIRTGNLSSGQMGYAIVGLRDPRQARPGSFLLLKEDIQKAKNNNNNEFFFLHNNNNKRTCAEDTAAVTSTKSALFASVHPEEVGGFDDLCNAVDRLALNDTGLEVHRTSGSSNNASSQGGGAFLGPGLRIGFQGLLHVEVFRQRLSDEFGIEAIVTPPKVPYKILYHGMKEKEKNEPIIIEDLIQWPKAGEKFSVEEPIVDVKIMAPMDYAGSVMDLIKRKRGTDMQTNPIDDSLWLFSCRIPWAEVVTDFHDELKTYTAGYASFSSHEADPPYSKANLSKVDIMLNGEIVDPLAFVSHQQNAQSQARVVCKKLQQVLPRRQFVTIIQAKASGKIIASERIKAYRKDVLIKSGKVVGGGDSTRKKKLLEKQKKGKKRQQESGKITLSQAAFNSVINKS